jgi:hypothetical protein
LSASIWHERRPRVCSSRSVPRSRGRRQDKEVSWLNGELTQLSVSLVDQRQAVEEQEAAVLGLQQAAETARVALDTKKK